MLVILFLALSAAGLSLAQQDGCSSYTTLNQPHRSTRYRVDYPEVPLCDDTLIPGWYRFQSGAGNQMPDSVCPAKQMCGTMVPIWLNGTHPTVAEGAVFRTACANYRSVVPNASDCCQQKVEIAVQNCGSFYVYYLLPTPSCPMAYCAGTRAPCPSGTWSPSGFADTGCRPTHPNMTAEPVLTNPELPDQESFRFGCRITHAHRDPEQRFEVSWTFNHIVDGDLTEVLDDSDRIAYLDGADLIGHFGTMVRCKVRAFYDGNQAHPSPWRMSNPYHATIQIDPPSLVISEAEEERNVTLSSTVPIVCSASHRQTFGTDNCCINVRLNIRGQDSHGNLRQNSRATTHKCKYQICTSHWNAATNQAVVEVPVKATRDLVRNPDRELDLVFEHIPSPIGGSYMQVFSNFRIPSVRVTVRDLPSGMCKIYSDPRINTIDRSYDDVYDFRHFQQLGDYTAFIHSEHHFEVQIRTYPYSNRNNGFGPYGTCVCAVAIREGDDVVRVDACNEYWHYAQYGSRGVRHTTVPRPTIRIPRKLSDRTQAMVRRDGQNFVIYMPSGAEISVHASYYGLDTVITLPTLFRGPGGRGLCGTFDGNSNNEHTTRYGVNLPSSRKEEFVRSWKAEEAASIFKYVPELLNETKDIAYCQCHEQGSAYFVNCTSRGDIGSITNACRNCPRRDGPTQQCHVFLGHRSCWSTVSQSRKRVAESQFVDVAESSLSLYDPDEHQDIVVTEPSGWPTASNITEASAEQHCRQALNGSPLFAKLESRQAGVLISDCKADIQLTDGLSFLESYTKVATSSAQLELAQDPANYHTDPVTGEAVLKPEISTDLCDPSCARNNGTCLKGHCTCRAGSAGVNCQLDATTGPQIGLTTNRSTSVCDTNLRPCRKIFVEASNFEISDSLYCKVRQQMPDGSLSSDPLIEAAEVINMDTLACALPDAHIKTDRSYKTYTIEVTMDGSLYGNQVKVTVFDSSCQDCSGTGCQQLPNTCLINHLCYQNGDLNPVDNETFCDVATDTTQWTSSLKWPKIESVSLSLVGASAMCSVQVAAANNSYVTQVMWMYNGRDLRASPLKMSSRVASYGLTDLPSHGTQGQLACRVRTLYDTSNISPYVRSNIVDLA